MKIKRVDGQVTGDIYVCLVQLQVTQIAHFRDIRVGHEMAIDWTSYFKTTVDRALKICVQTQSLVEPWGP